MEKYWRLQIFWNICRLSFRAFFSEVQKYICNLKKICTFFCNSKTSLSVSDVVLKTHFGSKLAHSPSMLLLKYTWSLFLSLELLKALKFRDAWLHAFLQCFTYGWAYRIPYISKDEIQCCNKHHRYKKVSKKFHSDESIRCRLWNDCEIYCERIHKSRVSPLGLCNSTIGMNDSKSRC